MFCGATVSRPFVFSGAGRSWIDRRGNRRRRSGSAVKAEIEAQHADGVLDLLATTEVVIQGEDAAVWM